MHFTIFETPLVNSTMRALSLAVLRLQGWTVTGSLPPDTPKCVLIAAPHTSNWDLPYTLMVAFALRLHIRWMGKASIFRFPFGPVMRWLGGIAVDRSKASNTVQASADALKVLKLNYPEHPYFSGHFPKRKATWKQLNPFRAEA